MLVVFSKLLLSELMLGSLRDGRGGLMGALCVDGGAGLVARGAEGLGLVARVASA